MTLVATQRAGLVLRAWLAPACAVLAPAVALALDASQLPPLRGESVETPSLKLGGGVACTSCDASPLNAVTPLTGAQPYVLAEQAGDRVQAMAFLPALLRAAVRGCQPTVNLTPYIQAALNTGKSVEFAPGCYQMRDKIAKS